MNQISGKGSGHLPSFSRDFPKVRQISLAACSLFNDFGIRRVTVEEICRVCGVSKRTFYHHFRNKVHLILHILDETAYEYRENYEREIGKIESYREKIMQGILLYQKFGAVFSPAFYSDLLNHPDEKLRDGFNRARKEIENIFLRDFLRAREIGDVRAGLRPEFLLYMLDLWKDLLSNSKLNEIFPDPLTLSRELNEFFQFGIFPRR